MGLKISTLIILLFYVAYSSGFKVVTSNFKNVDFRIQPTENFTHNHNRESPLFLTPFIEKGRISEARQRARVRHHEIKNIKSYSGYLTVNKDYNSNLFFWYFPSQGNPSTDPLILWLQGGPGVTSLYGLFTGNGPFGVTKNNTLEMRDITWISNHNILYIDSPVGTGFSFSEDDLGYATRVNEVALNLYIALRQFFKLFPGLQKNELYVMGESYAGKYVPALGYVIHRSNADDKIKQKINLAGLAIGNGWTDPINQIQYAEYLYQIALIDENGRRQFKSIETEVENLLRQEKYTEAVFVNGLQMGGDRNGNPGLFENLTGYDYYYHYLQYKSPESLVPFSSWVQRPSVLRALHVGNQEFEPISAKVNQLLIDDIMRSVAVVLAALLENYRVLIYYGQMDIICAYPLAENYLQQLDWSGAEEYKTAPRNKWFVNNELAGYVKSVGNLYEVLVRNAGHMVPTDQPLWAWTMISNFTRRQPI